MPEHSDTGAPEPQGNAAAGPLHLDQTRVYLAEWRARHAVEAAPFSEEEVQIIQQVSGGDPGRIKRLADQRCHDPAAFEPPARRLSAGIAAVLLAGLGLGFWLGLKPDPPERRVFELEPPARTDNEGPRLSTTPQDPSVPVVPAVHVDGLRSAAWLREEDPDRYVLQLISAVEVDTIENYLRHAELPVSEISLVLAARRGRLWHVLVYGLYPDAGTARREARRLPDYARLQGPWPRRVGDVMERAVWEVE